MIALVFLASIYSPNCLAYAYDGETIERCDGRLLHLAGIDAPDDEDAPQCRLASGGKRHWCDTQLSQTARQTLDRFLNSGPATVWYAGAQNQEGHFLVSVSINGMDAGAFLVGRGLARRLGELPPGNKK